MRERPELPWRNIGQAVSGILAAEHVVYYTKNDVKAPCSGNGRMEMVKICESCGLEQEDCNCVETTLAG